MLYTILAKIRSVSFLCLTICKLLTTDQKKNGEFDSMAHTFKTEMKIK